MQRTCWGFLLCCVTLAAPASNARGNFGVDYEHRDLYVIAIGVDNYSWQKLACAVADARSVAGVFEQRGKGLFAHVHTSLLINEQATRPQIQAAFDAVAARARPDDVFVFYFAGSGTATGRGGEKEQKEFYLITPDVTSTNDPAMLASRAVSSTLVRAWCSRVASRNLLILLDACDSEEAFRTFAANAAEENTALRELVGRSVTILGPAGKAFELESLGHGLFTYVLLQGLAGEADLNKSGIITARFLEAYLPRKLLETALEKKMPEKSRCASFVQGGDFPIARVPKPGTKEGAGPSEPPSRARIATAPPAPLSGVAKGKDYALFFATGTYADKGFAELANPVRDAETLAGTLAEKYGFERPEVVANPKYVQILETLKRYKERQYADGDQLFIFFAGHGVYDEDVRDGFLAAADSLSDAVPGSGNLLQFSNLRAIADNIPCKHVFLVIDACFSGTFDLRVAQAESRAGPDPDIKKPEQEYVQAKMRYRTRKFLTSGRKETVSDGLPGEHSPFARALLEMLRDYSDRGRLLTFRKMIADLVQARPEPCSGTFGHDDPGSDFIFLPR
jgi:uncharacterized caspase-like protein